MRILPPPLPVFAMLVGLQLVAAVPAAAIGPDVPLTFRDSFERLDLVIGPQERGDLSASWTLYDHGKVVREKRLDFQMEKGSQEERVAEIPLGLDELSNLKPGYYAVKIIVVETPAKGETTEPLRIDQWVHVVVSESGVHRVTQEEYSGATDPVELGVDAAGERVLLSGGAAGKAEVPLDKTEHHQAPALGLGGGAVQEQPGEQRQLRLRDESQEP